MPEGRSSLLAGRNRIPLTSDEARRVAQVFIGLDSKVAARYEEDASTSFRIALDDDGAEYGEIVFGPDIYPGRSVADPNSVLGPDGAAAHELTHYHRWREKRQLDFGVLTNLDEALTSLEAIQRYEKLLSPQTVRELVSDALQRLYLHVDELDRSGGQAKR